VSDNINWARVFGGGLVAGLIINIGEFILNEPILGADFAAAMTSMNKEAPGPGAIMVFVMLSFAIGILAVWLYAAIRPRFGAGAKTAACAGLTVWGLGWLYPMISFVAMDFFPFKIILIASVWGLVEVTLATVAGAWLYREAAQPVS
jgi:hypothetical protein